MNINLTLRPIGVIRSPFKQKFGTPRQSGLVPQAEGTIELDPLYAPPGCLEGLSSFSHIWVIFHFHKNTNEILSGKVQPPRLNGEKMGLFATRTPHRPNPLGLSILKIIDVDEENLKIKVSGMDVIDGTPIFDIKPYLAEIDALKESTAGWTENKKDIFFDTQWSPKALDDLQCFDQPEKYKKLIEQTLQQDLRNLEDKSKNEIKIFKTLLGEGDVEFQLLSDHHRVEVLQVTKKNSL